MGTMGGPWDPGATLQGPWSTMGNSYPESLSNSFFFFSTFSTFSCYSNPNESAGFQKSVLWNRPFLPVMSFEFLWFPGCGIES